jgi:hypothetical protein
LLNKEAIEKKYYRCERHGKRVFKIYYKNKPLYIRDPIYTHIFYIYNYLTNKIKLSYNNVIWKISDHKFYNDPLSKSSTIFINKDKIIEQNNAHFIFYYYKFINSIKYKHKFIINSNDSKLHYKYQGILYNFSIYRYKIFNNIYQKKYNMNHILIPTKYEFYYYSKYFHIYFD